jgi:integrase
MKIDREKHPTLNAWVWKADFRCNKKRYRPWAFSKAELDEKIRQIQNNADREKLGFKTGGKITLGQAIALHIKDYDLSIEYYRRGKVVLEMLRAIIGTDMLMTSLTTSDLKDFIRYRRSQNPKLQNSSINKDLTYISQFVSKASENFKELKDYNPPRIPWESESTKPNDRTIYADESKELLAYLRYPKQRPNEPANSVQIREDYADMYELAMNTAMRWGEVAQIEWSMVHLKAAEIVLPKRITKTDEPRTVPLNPVALKILQRRYRTKWAAWVFPRKDGLSYRKYYYDRLRSIAKKLGLPFGRDVGFTLHTTRHTAITEMQDRGADLATVQQISGHSDKTMAMRYSHSNKKRVRDAVNSLVEK